MHQQWGKVVIPSGINVWPHELETAKALAGQGRVVEFIPRSEGQHESNADVTMDGIAWEMKAPKASSLAAIERNIRRACRQSRHVILDVRRMRGIPAAALEREARTSVRRVRELESLVLVCKDGSVVDIL